MTTVSRTSDHRPRIWDCTSPVGKVVPLSDDCRSSRHDCCAYADRIAHTDRNGRCRRSRRPTARQGLPLRRNRRARRQIKPSYVRLSRVNGGIDDVEIPSWTFHDDGLRDIAVAPITLEAAVHRHSPPQLRPTSTHTAPCAGSVTLRISQDCTTITLGIGQARDRRAMSKI
jgi:hypothetical protein